MSVYEDIQACKRDLKTKTETARVLHLARGTVRKFWKMSEVEYGRFCDQAAHRRQRFDPYREEIVSILEINAADGQEVYISSLFDVLEERHGKLPGNQRTLGNYVRMLRDTGAVAKKPHGPVRRPQEEVEPGKQCQIDFGQRRVSSTERAYIFAAVLASSRAKYVRVQDHPFCTREVIAHTLASFHYFGGRPETLVLDQDKLMTVSENAGEIVHTADFRQFLAEQELRVWLCRKGDPESKGKIENVVKFVKTSFFSARRFNSVEEIHEPLAGWLARRANGQICQATARVPAFVLEHEERPALRPLRASVYERSATQLPDHRKVDAKAMISYGGNRYSVPEEYRGAAVGIETTDGGILIRDAKSDEEIASHRLLSGKGAHRVAPEHRVPRGHKAEEVYAELATRNAGERWHAYLDGNRQRYPRYWKEQTASLRRLLSEAIDWELLRQALEFCVESDSYGVGDLRYAYQHLVEAAQLQKRPLLEHVRPIVEGRKSAEPAVARRNVGYYSSLVSLILGGAA